MAKIAGRFASLIQQARKPWYFGFVEGHRYLSEAQLRRIRELVGVDSPAIVRKFEQEFAALIGSGDGVAFASARMGFYAVLVALGVGANDEVILPGFTCSVMVNAVLRTGATPVFADIDPETLGSSAAEISKCITHQTRLIVAQHSFGIPCAIREIAAIAKARKIALVEDCALTLGSASAGVVVGNFGDAAIFSVDHTKPVNAITGGLVYSNSADLINKLRIQEQAAGDLPFERQRGLWERFLVERITCSPEAYRWMGFVDLFQTVRQRYLGGRPSFLTDDFSSSVQSSYPYPARLPGFLACLGLFELGQWPARARNRKRIGRELIGILKKSPGPWTLPFAYFDASLDIVPLRFAWIDLAGELRRKQFSDFVHTSSTWFMKPIIGTQEPLENFGYVDNACPVAEKIGASIVNLPCNFEDKYSSGFLIMVEDYINNSRIERLSISKQE